MNKDLVAINNEIEELMNTQPTMDKYQRLGVLFTCKKNIEDMLKSDKSTTSEILDDKMEKIGARSTLLKLEPILSQLVKDIEMISPTISGVFIKKIREM